MLISFTFLVAIVFIYALQYRLAAAHMDRIDDQMDQVANVIMNEVRMAAGTENGYSRIFSLPQTISGIDYQVDILGSDELVIYYMNREKVVFLDDDVYGGIGVGRNLVEKIDNIIYISNLDAYNDTLPPNIASVTAVNENTVRVVFNEQVASTAGTTGHYEIKGPAGYLGVNDADLLDDNKTVILRVSPYHVNNTIYNLTATDIYDRADPPNRMVSDSKTYIYIKHPVYLIMTEYFMHKVIYPDEQNMVYGHVEASDGLDINNTPVDVWLNNRLENNESGFSSSWALSKTDFRFRCNITVEEKDSLGRVRELIVLNASFLNKTCYNIIGAMENSIRIYENNTHPIVRQVDDWNNDRTDSDDDGIIDANDEIVFFANLSQWEERSFYIYYDDLYNQTPFPSPSSIKDNISQGEYFKLSNGNIRFEYNLSGDYPGIVNMTSPSGVLIDTKSLGNTPGRLMDSIQNVNQDDATVSVVMEGSVRSVFLLKTDDDDREEYLEIYDKKPYWKSTYTLMPQDPVDPEYYHLLLVSGIKDDRYYDGVVFDPGTYQNVTTYVWQPWFGSTGIGAIMAIDNDDTPFLNGSTYDYNYLHGNSSTNYSGIFSHKDKGDMGPGYFWTHVTDLGHTDTQALAERLRNPVIITVEKEDFFLHTDFDGNYKFRFDSPGPPNPEGWYNIKVNTSKDNEIGVRTEQFYSSYTPLVYLVSPGNHTTKSMPATLYCNATDYEDLLDVSLYGNWTGTWELNQTKLLHEFEPDAETLFLVHFNGDALTHDGEPWVHLNDITFQDGMWRDGAFFGPDDSNITYNTSNNLNPIQGTIEFWINPISQWVWNSTDYGFFSSTNSTRCDGFEFWRDKWGRIKFSYGAGGYDCADFAIASFDAIGLIKKGEWHHLAATWKSDNISVYLNGEMMASTSFSDINYLSQTTFEIGNIYPSSSRYGSNATLDEFRIYNRSLSADEIRADYERSIPIRFVVQGFPVDLPEGEYAWNCKVANENGEAWSQRGNYTFLVP